MAKEGVSLQDILHRKSYSNIILMLIDNEARNRVDRNYAKALSQDYNFDRGYISGKLSDLDGYLAKSHKEGNRKIFRIRWDKLRNMLYQSQISYPYLPEDGGITRNDRESWPQEWQRGQRNTEEALNKVWRHTDGKLKYLLKEYLKEYSRRKELKKTDNRHINSNSIHSILRKFVISLAAGARSYERLKEKIDGEKVEDEEKWRELIQLQEDKIELLENLLELTGDCADPERTGIGCWTYNEFQTGDIMQSIFEDYFNLYLLPSNEEIAIEKELFKRAGY